MTSPKQASLFELQRAELARKLAEEDLPHCLLTVGHSTRPLQEFIALLQHFRVQQLVDIRHFPASRHNPQFNQATLATALRDHGIEYVWLESLGGYRRGGYLAHMETETFRGGVVELEQLAAQKRTAIMCAELKWWRCHRRHVSDVMTARGWSVLHIMTERRVDPHIAKSNPIRCDWPSPPAADDLPR